MTIIKLNAQESRRFLKVLRNPPAPNKKLKRLLAQYKNKKQNLDNVKMRIKS